MSRLTRRGLLRGLLAGLALPALPQLAAPPAAPAAVEVLDAKTTEALHSISDVMHDLAAALLTATNKAEASALEMQAALLASRNREQLEGDRWI